MATSALIRINYSLILIFRTGSRYHLYLVCGYSTSSANVTDSHELILKIGDAT